MALFGTFLAVMVDVEVPSTSTTLLSEESESGTMHFFNFFLGLTEAITVFPKDLSFVDAFDAKDLIDDIVNFVDEVSLFLFDVFPPKSSHDTLLDG